MKPRPTVNKPYNRCLSCIHRIERRCDGPRTSAMELQRWCEYMRDMKQANALTNAEIAERAEVSMSTVESVMALTRTQDLHRDTARRIEDAIIGSSNQYPCYLAFEESQAGGTQAAQELERTKNALDNIHASYQTELQAVRHEAQVKIDYLLEEIRRLRLQADYLRTENDRKAAIIDKLMQ